MGEPLKMVREGGGLILYSEGPDMEDEGGEAWNEEARNSDITVTLGIR